MTRQPILDATGVAKSYGAVAALRNASLSVLPGEVHALMGANGAGKSTLVKILTGAIRPDAGRVLIRGEVRRVLSPADARRAGLVSVYQEPALIPDLDIAANLRLTGTPVEAFRGWVRELGVPALDIRDLARDIPLAVLRVLDLARALALQPDVLLLDEMTAALPADLAEKVLEVVRRENRTGRSVIFISHRFIEFSALCDRATVLRDGETVGVVDMAPGAEEKIVELMLGTRVEKARAAARTRTREPLGAGPARLSVRGLSAGTKLQDVSFDLANGEVTGVVALEGQGQDELFRVLSGSMRPSGGSVEVDGRPVRFAHPADAIEAGIAYVPGDRAEALLVSGPSRDIALPLGPGGNWGVLDIDGAKPGRPGDRALQIDTRAQREVQRLSRVTREGHDHALDRRRGAHDLVFDPTRHRHRHPAPDLPAAGELAEQASRSCSSRRSSRRCSWSRSGGGHLRRHMVDVLPARIADEATLTRAAYGLPRDTSQAVSVLAQRRPAG